ncbi:MAG TPA: hypothetical protein VGS19_16170 [Streptosporangiaceae bacterium]|nr:hypothetical protein [Streptosporangiaceae bacterium]
MADVRDDFYVARGRALTLVHGFLRQRPCPVIVFSGPHDSGKTALLDDLAERMQGMPHALIYCQDFHGGTRELLALLAFSLNRRSGRYGRLPFPRLITGLIVIHDVDLSDLPRKADRPAARDRIRAMLEQRQRTAGLLTEAVSEIITAEMPQAGLSPADTSELTKLLLQVGPALVLGGLARLRRGRQLLLGAAQDWYGHQDRGLELDPLDVLVDINQAAADGTPGVAELLLAAFLADLRHAFTRRPASDHAFNCAVLLDNADTGAARDFLRILLQARSHQREPDPLTVVVTSRGDLVEGVRADDSRWHVQPLPDLSYPDVMTMVRRLDLPLGTNYDTLASAVYRYTCGHPGGVGAMVDAVARTRTTDLAAILDLRQPGDQRTLGETLLRRLLRGLSLDEAADLVTCSAATDQEAALRLAGADGLLGHVRDGTSKIFRDEFWSEQAPTGRRLYPLLRRLALRALAARRPGDGPSWAEAHTWLRDNCDDAGSAVTLSYSLALGEVALVGTSLADAIRRESAGSWIALLESVTSSPNNLRGPERTLDGLRGLTGDGDLLHLPFLVSRLVTAMWIYADPLSGGSEAGLREDIHTYLTMLASHWGPGAAQLYEYAKRYAGNVGPVFGSGHEQPPPSFDPPLTSTGLRGRRRRRVLAVAAAVLVAAGAVTAGLLGILGGQAGSAAGPPLCPGGASGQFRVFRATDGECVGVTDGSFQFDPGVPLIQDVEQRIRAENARVTSGGPYVSVVLLMPLTTGQLTDVSPSRIADVLRGAYLAQYYHNHETHIMPRIRLLLANEGSQEQAWAADWGQLKGLTHAPGQLVAISGMGISVQQTIEAARRIGSPDVVHGGIPMFGAVTTADGLDATVTPDLVQVAPSVADEVHALARYLSRPQPAVLVYDSQASDLYTATLRADFTRVLRSRLSPSQIAYEPSGQDSALFKKIAQDLCANRSSPVVVYAGRNSVFDSFITQLEQEGNCTNRHLEIVTGGDADGLDPAITRDSGVGAQVSVIYSDIEDQRAVTSDFRSNYVRWLGLSALPAIDDPWLLASYNAATAADDAIELAAGSITQPARMKPTDVAPWLNQLNGSTEVIGATGTFSIGADGDLVDPGIPIYELTGGHRIQLAG